jgi:hypothetical protein
MTDLLAIYLDDHLAAATGGLELFRRAARNQADQPHGEQLAALADEVAGDHAALREMIHRLGAHENLAKAALGWAAEKAGRLKLNGHLVTRSPLSDLTEVEGLRLAVQGKLAGWQVLRDLAAHDDRLPADELDELVARAEDQAGRLEALHREVAARCLGPSYSG